MARSRRLHHLGPVTHVSDVAAGARPDPSARLRRGPRDRRLARRIDVGERSARRRPSNAVEELVEQVVRPGVAVRLEHDDAPPGEALAGGRQRRADLRRMMAVVVDQQARRGRVALDLEAALDTREARERRAARPRTAPRDPAPPTAVAASALATLWTPGTWRRSSPSESPLVETPRSARSARSSAHERAPRDRPARRGRR